MQRKINKKTIIIAIVLIFATIISVFAISIAIQASKVATNANISPYKYSLVVAYYGYWESGGSYFADVDYPGQRKNIGKVPSEYAEFDLTFPTTLIEGNYEIDDIIDFRNYTGTWEDLNYNNISYNEFNDHYIEYASIWNPQTYIGEKNTEVTFTASFRLLNPPNKGFPGNKFAKGMGGGVYKCYIAVVVKYVDSDFLADPEGWWDDHGGNPDDPGDGDITVTIKYVDEDDKKLMSDKTRKTSLGANLVENSERIDGYKCTGYSITGKETKSFSDNLTSFVVGLFDYSTPVDNNLIITFHYEEYEEPEKPKCDPQFDAEAEDARVTMKRRDFDNATDIFFSNVKIGIDDFEGRFKQISGTDWEEVEGEHKFHSFDIYLKYPGSTSYDFTRYDIYLQTAYQNLNVPEVKFTPTNAEKTEYIAEVEVTLGVFCTCGGFNAEKTTLRLYVDIVENQPPTAYYRYSTKKTLPSGTESREYGKVYIGKDVVIDNYSDDPNGLTDIDYSRFIFRNNSGQVKSIQFKMMPWGAYELDEADSFEDTSIIFNGTDNGNINVVFTTDEEWEVTVYVEDTEGLTDSYTEVIKPEELTLKPTAVIKDTSSYRYPIGQEFNGKQNRMIKLDSNSSYVASWLNDMDVEIDHQNDMWQIEPMDGQDINSVKFERDINKLITGNILKARYEPLNIKMMFKEPGRYKIRLQVTDTEGNVSDSTEQVLTINEDLPPTITADINPKYYRNSSKIATIRFNAFATSNDDDLAEITNIGYKFDSNNNGSFTDEILQTSNLSHKDVNINGVLYKEITLTSSKVGKYQFIINVKEDFKQETIEKYITNEDYKTALTTVTTEVDNIAPVGTLGLEKNNNIDVKVLTTGLTGTRQVDVENNLNNLKIWLESKNNIKVGNIELLNLANEKNGLTNEDSLTWRKVAMNGYVDNHKFKYAEIDGVTDTGGNPETDPEKPLVGFWYNLLPNGIYADGWNGIPVPNLYLGDNLASVDITNLKYKDIYRQWGNSYPIAIVERDYYHLNYTNNNVNTSIHNTTVWGTPYSDVTFYSAITNKKLRDFDIQFDLNIYPVTYGEDSMGSAVFLFNVKDKNNYFAYSEKYYKNWVAGNKIAGIVQVKNGVSTILQEFYYTRKKEHGEWEYYETIVSRVRQVGNLLQAYYGDKLVFEKNINSLDAGGYLGISAKDGYTSSSVDLDIKSLTYIDNSSIYEAVNNLSWGNETDKYIINLVENNKLKELTDNTQLNKTAGLLQGKEINLINIGVNSVSETKLKELTTKNQNNGTYIELGNVYDNLNAAATYIGNKYSGSNTLDQYLLLGSTVNYKENYSDNENDPLFSKAFKFYHLPTYFENNLGTINNNNNIWVNKPIETFKKTGKYTLNYRVQDNPLFPDLNLLNSFNDYRKYSNIFTQDIYVHRKPISNFNIGNFSNNAYVSSTFNEDFSDNIYAIEPSGGYLNNGYWEIYSRRSTEITTATLNLNVPSNAINAKLNVNLIKESGTGYANIVISSIGVNDMLYSNSNLTYSLNPGSSTVYIVSRATKGTSSLTILLDSLQLSYSIPNDNATVTITESSFDIDHNSQLNKGISEWQWKLIDQNGITTNQNFTIKASGVTWIQNSLKNAKWFNATVLLRVKDLEGVWSDWSSKYIDGEAIRDGWCPELNESIPIADFLIDKDPLIINSESQTITDTSYDTGGSVLSYIWKVSKDDKNLFTSTQKDISSILNSHILTNGIGIYKISLIVSNSSGAYSDTVTKSFKVVIYNSEPTVNFNLVSNENPVWTFPKTLGLYTLRYRPTNTLFYEENARFETNIVDPNTDNTGFIYNWKLERFAVKDINNISGAATNTYNYTTQFPFVNSFKGQGLQWGAYRITLSATDKPPVPPYQSTDAKTATVTKNYYIVPEISLAGSFESDKSEIMVGDSIKLKAKTNKMAETVGCNFNGTGYALSKVSEDSNYAYWEKNITISDSITESGTYQLQFVGKTTYGGNGNVTREVKDNVPINIVALKLINFRITNIVNHPYITFPYTKDMLLSNLIPYKTGYYVTFQIDSKGKPGNVYGRIDVGNNGRTDQVINMTKVVTGDTETWQGRFYSSAHLPINTIISIKLDCLKGSVIYNYNEKENWDGRSLITEGSALQDGRVNLTN